MDQNKLAHFFKSPGFLNAGWRTDVFFHPNMNFLHQHKEGWFQDMVQRLLDGKPGVVKEETAKFLRKASALVDGYARYLISHPMAAMDLGLWPGFGQTVRNYGYSLTGAERTKFWQALLVCHLIDRILWAHDLCVRNPGVQYIHPAVVLPEELTARDYEECVGIVRQTAALGFEVTAQSSVDVPQEPTEAFQTATMVAAGGAFMIRGTQNLIYANFCWMASMCLFLAEAAPAEHLREVLSLIKQRFHIDSRLTFVIEGYFRSQDLALWHRIYKVLIEGWLYLLQSSFLTSTGDTRKNMGFWMMESSRPVGDIPWSVISAEKSIIRALCDVLDVFSVERRFTSGKREDFLDRSMEGRLAFVLQTLGEGLQAAQKQTEPYGVQQKVWEEDWMKGLVVVHVPITWKKRPRVTKPIPIPINERLTFDAEFGFHVPSTQSSSQPLSQSREVALWRSQGALSVERGGEDVNVIDSPDEEDLGPEELEKWLFGPLTVSKRKGKEVQEGNRHGPSQPETGVNGNGNRKRRRLAFRPSKKIPKKTRKWMRDVFSKTDLLEHVEEGIQNAWEPFDTDPRLGVYDLPEVGQWEPRTTGSKTVHVAYQARGRESFVVEWDIEWPNASVGFFKLEGIQARLDDFQYKPSVLISVKELANKPENEWILSIGEAEFDALPTASQMALFASHDIHVFREERTKETAFDSPRGFKNSRQALEFLEVDLRKTRMVYKNQTDDGQVYLHRGTLEEVLGFDGQRRLDLNILNIPLPGSPIPIPHTLRSLSCNTRAFQEYSPGEIEMGDLYWANLYWAIFSTEPAKTEAHIDAGGCCTWVEILTGAKLWYIRKPASMWDGNDLEPVRDELDSSQWEGVLLLPGDKLVMQPNTTHKVFTLRESIAVGGHFYSFNQLERTLVGRLREHYLGPIVVNAEQPGAQVMMLRLGHLIWRELHANRVMDEVDDKNLAALIYMLLQPHLLIPPKEKDLASAKKDKQGRPAYYYQDGGKKDREVWDWGKRLAYKLMGSVRQEGVLDGVVSWSRKKISWGILYAGSGPHFPWMDDDDDADNVEEPDWETPEDTD